MADKKEAYVLDADRFSINIIVSNSKRVAIIEDKLTGRTYDAATARALIGYLEEALKTAQTVNAALT